MTSLLADRFEIVRELGRGASTVVVLAKDRAHDVVRAVKLASSRGQLRSFRNEYYRLCELRHPHIVRAYDFGTTAAGMPFYTMEHVEGAPLSDLGGRLDSHTIATIALQTLDALAVLHARGLVHRDLKPRNLMIVGMGSAPVARLIDLGLAVTVGSRARAAGTLPYVAPEVLRGEAADGRADLYSLGVLLYELLLPEESARTLDDLTQRLKRTPPPPSQLNPLIPSSLSAFVCRLLAPTASERYADAMEASMALVQLADLELHCGPPRLAAERLMHAGAVSHRRAVRTKLHKAARTMARTHKGGVWCLDAPVGVGKTPVLRELAVLCNLAGMRVLQWSATSEAGSPLRAMMKAAAALGPIPDSRIDLFWPDDDTLSTGERSAQMTRLGQLLAQSLASVPTVVLLDDLQEAEPAVIEVLSAFGCASSYLPLLVVAASEFRDDGPTVATLLGPNAATIALRPLSSIQVARLVSHRLWALRLPAPALDRLVRDSQGMPSLVERTLAHLVIDRTVQRRGRRWVFVGGRYRPARHGSSAVVMQRLAGLSSLTRQVLFAAAVLAVHLHPKRIAAVAGIDVKSAVDILNDFVRQEILDTRTAVADPTYEFDSRATQAAVYQAIPAALRRQLHDRAALQSTDDDRCGASNFEEIEHVLRGTDDERAVSAALRAGDEAAALYADRRAIDYYVRAHARLRDRDDARARATALRLGRLYMRTGELEHAASWYREVTCLAAVDDATAIRALAGLGAVDLLRGRIDDAEQSARYARTRMQSAKVADPDLTVDVARLEARVEVARGDAACSEQVLHTTLSVATGVGRDDMSVEVLIELARLAQSKGQLVVAVRYARRALQRAKAQGDAAGVAEASVLLGRGLMRGGRYSTARRVLMHGLRVARSSRDRLREAQALRQLGNVQLRLCDLDGALERYTGALELARGLGARIEEVATLRDIGTLRARCGDFRPAFIALHAAMDVASGGGDVHGGAYSALELAYAYAESGHHRAAVTFLEKCRQLGGVLHDSVLDAEATALAAWQAVTAGNHGPAGSVGERVMSMVVTIEDPGQRARALLYAGRCCLHVESVEALARVVDHLQVELDAADRRDYRSAWQVLAGQLAYLTGNNTLAVELLATAASAAASANFRLLEVEARSWLGRMHHGTDTGAQESTRAMEVMREVVLTIPVDLAPLYLARPASMALRTAFVDEHARCLPCIAGSRSSRAATGTLRS